MPAPGRVGRDEQGEARRANTTLNGGPHLELGRLRLKTWSKSDFSIAETTWTTYLYIYLFHRMSVWSPMNTVVESTKIPGELVALTHYRGLQFSCSYLGQGESPPRSSVEMRESEHD